MKLTYCFINPLILPFSLKEKAPQICDFHVHEATGGCFVYTIYGLAPEP
jgi:hypothetical protein